MNLKHHAEVKGKSVDRSVVKLLTVVSISVIENVMKGSVPHALEILNVLNIVIVVVIK
jgi:hypothetical protein